MATWIAHLRIADALLEYGFDLQPTPFLLGNLAPDVTSIPKTKTHYLDRNKIVQPEDFYEDYLRDQQYDRDTFSFMVGFYVHLLVDIEWIGNVWRPLKHDEPELAKRIETDPEFGYQFKRLEYVGHDFLYLDAHPDYPSWHTINTVTNIPTYSNIISGEQLQKWLDSEVKPYYATTDFTQQVKTHEFRYLSNQGLLGWMHCTTSVLVEMLKGKTVPCPNPHPLLGGYILPYA